MGEDRKAKISVIVPVYNVQNYLRKCVDSLLGQTLREIQVILVNDGSKDSSGEIIDEYVQKDLRVVAVHKENGGISSARNEGLKYVCGEYVTFVDSDDWVDLDMYETMVKAADEYEADIVSTLKNQKMVQVHTQNILQKQLLQGDVSVCNKIFRKALIDENFCFDANNVAIDIKANYDFFAKCKRWVVIPGAFYYYRQDNVSYGRSGFSEADLNCVRLTECVEKLAKSVSEETAVCAKNHVIHAKFDIINKAVLFGYKTEKDKQIFDQLKHQYIRDIRRNIKAVVRSPYFSKNEILQMVVLWLSFPLFKLIKRLYKRTVPSSCEYIKC